MNKEKIIDYIYGEMSASEKKAFEAEMAINPDLKDQVTSLQEVQGMIQVPEEVEPQIHPIVFPHESKRIVLSKWWAIAASLLILLVGGKVLDLRFQSQDNGFAIFFGEPQEEKIDKERSNEDQKMYMAQLEKSLNDLKNELQEQNNLLLASNRLSNQNNADIKSIDRAFKKESKEYYDALFNELKAYQEGYTTDLVQDLLQYVDLQRSQDLLNINEGLQNLAELIQLTTEKSPQYAYTPTQK